MIFRKSVEIGYAQYTPRSFFADWHHRIIGWYEERESGLANISCHSLEFVAIRYLPRVTGQLVILSGHWVTSHMEHCTHLHRDINAIFIREGKYSL